MGGSWPKVALTIHSQSALNGHMSTELRVSGAHLARLLGSCHPRHRPGPAYEALAAALRTLILDGRLSLRVRLPSERELAVALGVSRTTTTAAYDLLRGEGYVESRRGSGSRVALPTTGALDREVTTPGIDVSPSEPPDINMTFAALPAPGAMMDAIASATRDLAGHLGSSGYDPVGLRGLRRAVAEQYAERGVPTAEDQIVITSGAQHALALLLDVLVVGGDPVLVEVPSYPNALEAVRRAGARFVATPIGRRGWDLEHVETRFAQAGPRVAYLIPDFHNPTGFLMTDEQRAAVVAAAERAGTHLVVDETFARLDLEQHRPMAKPMAAHDPDGRVITIGSMSKAYWGGLRVGWIRCVPPLARRLAQARAAIDLASPVLDQLVAQHLLAATDQVLAERRALLTERRDALVAGLRRELPAWRFAVPRGGLCLWVELDAGDAEALTEAAAAEGVRLIPGSTFSVARTLDRFVRLPFTQPVDVLEEAVTRLASAARRLELGAAREPLPDVVA
jgi:DNA-binding transcriptional MocR family regulator